MGRGGFLFHISRPLSLLLLRIKGFILSLSCMISLHVLTRKRDHHPTQLFGHVCKWKQNAYLLVLLMVALKSRSGMLMSRANLSLMTSSEPCSIGMTSFRLLSRTSDPFTSTSYEDTNVIHDNPTYFIIIQRDTDPRN